MAKLGLKPAPHGSCTPRPDPPFTPGPVYVACDRLLGLPGCVSDQGERHHAHPAKEKESSRRPAEHILQTSLEGNTLSSQPFFSQAECTPPPTAASEAPPCGLFTDTLLFPKAWLQGRLLRDALPGLIPAPANLAAGQVQARPLSSASTSAGRGPGPPTRAPRPARLRALSGL